MATRPNTLETTVFAIELLRRIPRDRYITAEKLHQRLHHAGIERDLRSVQRQLKLLSEHFGIDCNARSRPFGYRWLPNSGGLAVSHLSTQESLLLRLAEEHLRHLLPTRLMKSMEGFFAQARRNLGPDGNAKLEREWPGKVRVVATTQPLLPPKIAPGVMEAVSEALYSNHWLHLKYRNFKGKQGNHEVMPLGLAQQGPRLYLICRFRDYANERSVALHRILEAKVSTLPFERPGEFDLKRYDDEGRFGFGNGERIRISFQIIRKVGRQLIETPLSADQEVIELDNGWLQISATVVDTLMLRWWLRGFGEDVTQIETHSIR